jgi:hypothetical protein
LNGGSKGKLDAETRAAAGGGVDDERATETGDALLHAEEAHATLTGGIEANAVVFDREDEMVGVFLNENTNVTSVGVLGAVVQGFLDDAVDTGFVLFGKVVGEVVVDDVDDKASAAGDFAGVPLESGDEAEVVEHGGAKQQGDVADLAHTFFGEELDFLETAAKWAGSRRRFGEILHIHEESGEGLADLVVKLAGNSAPLAFLGVHETLGELLEFTLRAETFQVFFLGVTFETGNIDDGAGGQQKAEKKRDNGAGLEAMTGLREDRGDFALGLAEFEFVDVADLAGEGKNGSALGEGNLAQGQVVLFAGAVKEDAVGNEPVAGEFISKFLERALLVGGERTHAGVEGSVGVFAHVVKLVKVGVAGAWIGVGEGVFAEEIAGLIETEADVAESAFAVEVVLPDAGAAGFKSVQGMDGVKGEDGHEEQKGAKAGDHRGSRADTFAGVGRGGVIRGNRLRARHEVPWPGSGTWES